MNDLNIMIVSAVWVCGFLSGVGFFIVAMKSRTRDLNRIITMNEVLTEKLKSKIAKNEKELAAMTFSYVMRMRKHPKPRSASEQNPIEDIEA